MTIPTLKVKAYAAIVLVACFASFFQLTRSTPGLCPRCAVLCSRHRRTSCPMATLLPRKRTRIGLLRLLCDRSKRNRRMSFFFFLFFFFPFLFVFCLLNNVKLTSLRDSVRYEVEDVDPEEGQPKRFFASAKNIMPLPTSIPDTPRPEAEWAAGASVMALWPGSTCFYQAKVRLPPSKVCTEHWCASCLHS